MIPNLNRRSTPADPTDASRLDINNFVMRGGVAAGNPRTRSASHAGYRDGIRVCAGHDADRSCPWLVRGPLPPPWRWRWDNYSFEASRAGALVGQAGAGAVQSLDPVGTTALAEPELSSNAGHMTHCHQVVGALSRRNRAAVRWTSLSGRCSTGGSRLRGAEASRGGQRRGRDLLNGFIASHRCSVLHRISFPTSHHGEPHEPGAVVGARCQVVPRSDATCDSSTLSASTGVPLSSRRSGSQVQGRRLYHFDGTESRDWWGSNAAIGLRRLRSHHGPSAALTPSGCADGCAPARPWSGSSSGRRLCAPHLVLEAKYVTDLKVTHSAQLMLYARHARA
jgi:hypothetical protein